MEAAFWRDRWAQNQIGFHEAGGNAALRAHLPALGLAPGARLFLPLCGKTRDIAWLRAQFRVVGVERSVTAVEQLFDEMGLTPQVADAGPLRRYAAPGVEVFAGDVFDLDAAALGPVDAVCDRAALVALPPAMRARYAAHGRAITAAAPQLLIVFEYDQAAMDGPPFAVDAAEVARVHGGGYAARRLATAPVDGGLKGVCPADEVVWLLTPPG